MSGCTHRGKNIYTYQQKKNQYLLQNRATEKPLLLPTRVLLDICRLLSSVAPATTLLTAFKRDARPLIISIDVQGCRWGND